MLNQRQKVLLRFQRKNLIETSSSSEQSDLESKNDTIRLMDSKNPLIQLGVYGKLKRIVSTYLDHPLDANDRRILRGLYQKKLKDFDEDQEQIRKRMSLLKRLKFSLALSDRHENSQRLPMTQPDPPVSAYTSNTQTTMSNFQMMMA